VFLGVNDHGGEEVKCGYEFSKFTVMGHRGCGMNMVQSSVRRMEFLKENSILSFNAAAKLPIDFIEFDVQVKTKTSAHFVLFSGFFVRECYVKD
jgi:glycerophosphodiester phosphodiesterase